MIVYADVIFIINFVSAYIMLGLLGRLILKAEINKIRFCIASAVGAVCAVLIFSTEITLVWAYLLRIISVIIMVFTAFFEQKRHFLNHVLSLLCLSALMIAAMMAMSVLSGLTTSVTVNAGVIYFDLPPRIFLPMLLISYISVTVFIKIAENRRSKRRYAVTITLGDKTITVTALFDSGNLLKEPVTGKSVSIIEWSEARKLFDLECDFDSIAEHAEAMRLWAVPFHSLGKRTGIIFAFLADRLDIPEEKKVITNTFIGLYGESLSKNNDYHALLNAALL